VSGIRIAIDGPSGVGKSTTARELARRLDYQYVDTGAMYRAVGVIAHRRGISVDDGDELAALTETLAFDFPIVAGVLCTVVDGEELSQAIRTPRASMDASSVSRHPGVRRALVELQRALATRGGVVMEGRDIGTVVLPDAELKVFLDADPRIRGERRLVELRSRGEDADLEQVVAAIEARDHQDRTRADSPLRQAEGAVRVDTSRMGIKPVVDRLVELAHRAADPF
jgi:CMP/dCMP kinase